MRPGSASGDRNPESRLLSTCAPGTTAHVGIMLYGADGRSGHRHLDGDGAFQRNSLDVFQIATPHSLGRLWKIRVWHDNKGGACRPPALSCAACPLPAGPDQLPTARRP